MNALHNSLYALALGGYALLFFVVRHTLSDGRDRARHLIALLGFLSLNFALEWLMSNPASPAKSLWLTGVMGTAFFLGPCLWLHARSIVEPAAPRWRDLGRLHVVPIALGLVLLLPLLERTHLGTGFAHPDGLGNPHLVPIHATMLASIVVFAVQAAWYLRASFRLFAVQARAAKSLLSNVEDRELDSLRLLIFVVGAHWVVGIARAMHCLLLGKDAGYVELFAISEVMVTLWAVIALLRTTTTIEQPDRELAEELAAEPPPEPVEAPAAADAETKYAKSALDEPTRKRILRKLTAAWSDGLHRDARLTLRGLCAQLRENPHYVSQVINQDLGTSFYDLVNERRIADARLRLDANPEMAVHDIASEVGFNSKSTFNAAFKQHAGMTPSAWRRRGRETPATATSDPAG
jgi:AraC-like DNA-binding protein